jgi:hypothetical protein
VSSDPRSVGRRTRSWPGSPPPTRRTGPTSSGSCIHRRRRTTWHGHSPAPASRPSRRRSACRSSSTTRCSPGDDCREPGVELVEVVDGDGLPAYEDLVMTCWELDDADRGNVARLNRHWSGPQARGRRWLALLDGRPVGKGYPSVAGPSGVAAIFGMSVRPEARQGDRRSLDTDAGGTGQGPGLSEGRPALERDGHGVYRRAGFVERCRLPLVATARIWSGER